MIVTVNTDASFSHKHKVGAYAFWIVCNEGRIMQSGALKEAKDPTDAELRCIANALHVLLKANYESIEKIIINSDALYAFSRVGKNKAVGSPGRAIALILRKFKDKYQEPKDCVKPIHEFRHVKAHSGTKEKRKWVNDWCDKQAKIQMGKLLKSL